MIKSKSEMPDGINVDLTGPEGNAMVLMGYAANWLKQLGREVEPVIAEMKSGDYENLIKVFDREFGSFCTLYR